MSMHLPSCYTDLIVIPFVDLRFSEFSILPQIGQYFGPQLAVSFPHSSDVGCTGDSDEKVCSWERQSV